MKTKEKLAETLKAKFVGYGTYRISIEFNGKELSTITHNTLATDAAFDDCYDDEDNSGSFYKSQEQARIALVKEILNANDIKL